MKKELAGVVLILAVLAGAYWIIQGNENDVEGALDESLEEEKTAPEQIAEKKNYAVEITSSGYSPKELTINRGDSVTWTNVNSAGHWPASAMHPTHRVYPGSGIEKCGTDQEDVIFDACKGISPGESWSFTFNSEGTWRYHDHLNTANTGAIIVK